MGPGGHGEPLGLLGVEATLGTGHRLVLLVFEPFSLYLRIQYCRVKQPSKNSRSVQLSYVVVTVTGLASQARVLTVLVAGEALEGL